VRQRSPSVFPLMSDEETFALRVQRFTVAPRGQDRRMSHAGAFMDIWWPGLVVAFLVCAAVGLFLSTAAMER